MRSGHHSRRQAKGGPSVSCEVIAAGDKWKDDSDSVVALCDAGFTGEALFGGAIVDIVSTKVQVKLDAAIVAWAGRVKQITQEEVDKCVQDLTAAAHSVTGCSTHCKGKRKIDVMYRQQLLKHIEVKSLHEEVTLRAWARIKTMAVASSSLAALGCEGLLSFSDSNEDAKAKFAAGALGKCALAREDFNVFMKKQKCESADEVQQLVKEKDVSMQLADSTWKIEKAIFGLLAGDSAEQRYKTHLLAILPNANRSVEIASALVDVQALTTSAAFSFAPRDCQESVKHVVTMLTKVGVKGLLGL